MKSVFIFTGLLSMSSNFSRQMPVGKTANLSEPLSKSRVEKRGADALSENGTPDMRRTAFFNMYPASALASQQPFSSLSSPPSEIVHPAINASGSIQRKKGNVIQRLMKNIMERKVERKVNSLLSAKRGGDTISTLSLVFGVAGAIAIVTPGLFALIFLLGPAALIMGIIGLTKKDYEEAARTKALIGLILGGLLTGISIFYFILVLSFFA